MDLTLYLILLLLSLIIIAIGLFRPEHTEMALVGFVFLFLLGLTLEAGSIEYKTGVNETNTYSCLCCSNGEVTASPGICTDELNNSAQLVITKVEKVNTYSTFTAGGALSHLIGYWLMIMSIVGFIGVLVSLRAQRFD